MSKMGVLALAAAMAVINVQAQDGSSAIITSVNLNYLKSIFDRAGVPAQIVKNPGDLAHVLSTIGGNPVFVFPQNCAGNDPDGDCASFTLLSGIWPSSVPLEKVAAYALNPSFSSVLAGDPGTYMLRYSAIARNGIGPRFVEGSLIQFSQEMQNFGVFIAEQEKVAQEGGRSLAGGFTAKTNTSVLSATDDVGEAAEASLAAGTLAK